MPPASWSVWFLAAVAPAVVFGATFVEEPWLWGLWAVAALYGGLLGVWGARFEGGIWPVVLLTGVGGFGAVVAGTTAEDEGAANGTIVLGFVCALIWSGLALSGDRDRPRSSPWLVRRA